MKFARFALLLAFPLVLASGFAHASADRPVLLNGDYATIHGGNPAAGAARDTVYLIGPWGSGAPYNGQFESPEGAPAWNGWAGTDLTTVTESAWHADTYNVVSGVYSAWCGDTGYESCGTTDPAGGYGNSYDELLSWIGTVDDPSLPTTVAISATVNYFTEPGYDYVQLGYWYADQEIAYLWWAEGEADLVPVTGTVTYQPGQYVGEAEDQVRISWHVLTDGAFSDEDCMYPGDGAIQVDDITVTMTNGAVVTTTFDDFEDGTLGANWFAQLPLGVGDYAHIRAGLDEIDVCSTNWTPQVCFIADVDMEIERGLPGQECIDWCYGPHGRIVNTRGGAAGPEAHIHNAVESPVIPWPGSDYEGLRYSFDVYRHEDLSADSPGIFYQWGVRSTDSVNPADIQDAQFQDRGLGIYYGGPDYYRHNLEVADLVVQGPQYVQVRLIVYELGYIWGWTGDDGYPAPYFDNVSLATYSHEGPGMSARELDLFQDAFPADGQIHTGVDLGLNDVRLDMARNIALSNDMRNDPGDSVVIDIDALRAGSALVETDVNGTVTAPRLHFLIDLNSTFDSTVRLGAGPFTINAGTTGELSGEITDDGAVSGTMTGWVGGAPAATPVSTAPGRWQFDLPDEDFLYPGDVMHYYFEAWDDLAGDYQSARVPADLTGFGDFLDPFAYDPGFVVHALPTLLNDAGDQPEILFWNDFGDRGGRIQWYAFFREYMLIPGDSIDIYYTNSPSSGVGNGLGGRAANGQLDGYEIILYTSGDLGVYTISNGDFEDDAGDDIGRLGHWLDQDDKRLFITGDELVSDLWINAGSTGRAFVTNRLGVDWQSNDLRPVIGGDTAPMVYPVAGNPVFTVSDSWLAYGGCDVINTFDAVSATTGERLAVFNDGASSLSAATRHVAPNGSMVISLPYDFMFIHTPRVVAKIGQPASVSARYMLLHEVLMSFGFAHLPEGIGLDTPAAPFTVGAYPNPFNPAVKIDFEMPCAGRLSLKVYNVRGELVRTLVDETREQGPGFVMWDGADASGRESASGMYFYEAKTGTETQVGKLTLVR